MYNYIWAVTRLTVYSGITGFARCILFFVCVLLLAQIGRQFFICLKVVRSHFVHVCNVQYRFLRTFLKSS